MTTTARTPLATEAQEATMLVQTLVEAREIAARTFATAPEWVVGVHVNMFFGEVVVDREGVVREAAAYA
jgi:hypothetical protein